MSCGDNPRYKTTHWVVVPILCLQNAIGSGLSAPTNSIDGILAATASPAISYQIGQYFKVLAHKNQITGGKDELTAGQETAHILAHAILGAAVAAAGGNDALAGGLAAAGAEATAPILSQWLYGKNPADLTADEKATISAIAGLTGVATGVAVGGSMADVAQGNQAGHTAVDNNRLIVTGEKAAKKRYLYLLNKAQKQYKYKLDAKNRIVIDGYHYDDSQNPPVLVSDNPNGGILNPTDVANKTIIDAINKNEDIYLRLISDPNYIIQNRIFIDDVQSGVVDATKDLYENSDPKALMQTIVHYIKERESINNYEQVKSTIVNGSEPIFQSAHHKGLQTELKYLNEQFPRGNYSQGQEYSYIDKWKGQYVGIRNIPYGSKELQYYFPLAPTVNKQGFPLRPINVQYRK
ncbi:VENN motif pre-toxin domain-containing protein [Snodgrassella communis]|uniref:VENN motif pre-toxin domain-containing protein n=1 Tax=Snodgrassella communis TaxID=2946699 RepID=UPI001ED999F0|nr:VENN motif pre-toxin domain-containing protein [Snodgrassella communis]